MSKLKVIDSFCGAGGLSLGLAKSGFDILLSFDLEPRCIETLKQNPKYHNDVGLVLDVKRAREIQILNLCKLKKGELDLLAGGPPCQGFSVQRTVGKDHDDRNLLVDHYGDLVLDLMPKFFLMENVTGIGGKRGRLILEQFKKKIANGGYHYHETVLDAQDYGVPQRRKRYFLVGERLDSNQLFFRWPLPLESKTPTVRDTISWLPPAPVTGKAHEKYPLHRADKLSEKNLERIRSIKTGQSRQDLPEHLLADCHKVSANVIGHRNVYGRMDWDHVAPTITARFDSFTRGKFGHPEQDRSISLLEGSLLQTFPLDYMFTGSKVEIARQIGNAVPPLLAMAIGCSISKAIEEKYEL